MDVPSALSRLAGGPVTVRSATPVGSSGQVRRCAVAGPAGWGVTSVVVKQAVPREVAALRLLTSLGSDVAPAVLAVAGDVVVLEDLGDTVAPVTSFAGALGDLHAATRGLQGETGTRLAGEPFATWWSRLGRATAPLVPPPPDVPVLDWLAAPGPLVALSTGIVAPHDCRVGPARTRLLDFTDAQFHQSMLDVAVLLAGVPPELRPHVETAYRDHSPIDQEGLAYAITAWTVVRLCHLPALLAGDDSPGSSRRRHLLDTLDLATASGGPLSAWFADLARILRTRWRGTTNRTPPPP